MNPSSRSTLATATFRLVAGISTNGRSMALALRMRVSMSAIGSVIIAVVLPFRWLPGRLADAGDQAAAGHVAEADAADAELPVHGPPAATEPATEADLDAVPARHDVGGGPLVGRLLHLGLVLVQRRQLALELAFFGVRWHWGLVSCGVPARDRGYAPR